MYIHTCTQVRGLHLKIPKDILDTTQSSTYTIHVLNPTKPASWFLLTYKRLIELVAIKFSKIKPGLIFTGTNCVTKS